LSKKFLIIDDDSTLYEYFSEIILNIFTDCVIIPLKKEQSEILSGDIISYFKTAIKDEKRKIKKKINKYILNDIDGFIIDYELKENDADNINGLEFFNHFIKEKNELKNKPVLFVSGLNEDERDDLESFIENSKDGVRKIGFEPIPKNFRTSKAIKKMSDHIKAFFENIENNSLLENQKSTHLLVSKNYDD
jgi:5'-deoxynucleotidase YfbR-like HD superfamily hydrolase